MKKTLFVILAITAVMLQIAAPALAKDEGMYMPDKIAKLPLKKKGLKLKPEELYNPGSNDISEAIIRLSIGCTAEFISPSGLILTNHHCGFEALVSASNAEHDYGKMGYRAGNQSEELPAKDYSVTVNKRIEDVTAKITAGTEKLTGKELADAIAKNIKTLKDAEQAKVGSDSTINIQTLNSGLFYYLFESYELRDIRVVYAPPKNIGFFGGDPDNFEWTRHTGDFTYLRAYVGPDGKPADYSKNNVPFKPSKFLKISLDGLKDNDFVFVMGYPGGTTRYRESQAVDYMQNVHFPFLVNYIKNWSAALVKVGEADEDKRIKNQDQVFSLNNSYKAFDGGVVAMHRDGIIAKKQAQEEALSKWIAGDQARTAKYGSLLPSIKKLSDEFYSLATHDRVLRTIPNPGALPIFSAMFSAVTIANGKPLTAEEKEKRVKPVVESAVQNFEPIVETDLLKFFLKSMSDLPSNQRSAAYDSSFKGDAKARRAAEMAMINEVTAYGSKDKLSALFDMTSDQQKAAFPITYTFISELIKERQPIIARGTKFNAEIDQLRVQYQKAMAEMKGVEPYPDANFTQRFTYGNVRGYSPRESVSYLPFSTLDGVIEKDTGVEPFDVPQKLKDLFKAKDYGVWGVNGTVPVNFLSTNDIIGGNSGSPIMNANGDQVGIVFDGNYEGLGNDIFVSDRFGRTISVDIRYVLFLTEKFGDAGWLLKEMQFTGKKAKSMGK